MLRAAEFGSRDTEGNVEFVLGLIREAYQRKCDAENPEHLDSLERHVILQSIDSKWQVHLNSMEALREGVQLLRSGSKRSTRGI